MRRPLSRVNLAKLRELPAEVRQNMTRHTRMLSEHLLNRSPLARVEVGDE